MKSIESFEITTPITNNKVENLIDAYNQGLKSILAKFEDKFLQINLDNKE